MSLEKNLLIAKFMGSKKSIVDYTEYNDDGSIKYTAYEDGSKWMVDEYSKPSGLPENVYWVASSHGNRLMYDFSWDWLMPVLDKIRSLNSEIEIKLEDKNCLCSIEVEGYGYIGETGSWWINTSTINVVYNSIIEFIKWYREIKC